MPIFTQPEDDGGATLLETSQEELRKRYGIEEFDFPTPTSTIRHIGYSPRDQKWYGWSHRAIFGFGVGATVKAGDVIVAGPDRHFGGGFPVGFTAQTLDDAKRMAAQFAMDVS